MTVSGIHSAEGAAPVSTPQTDVTSKTTSKKDVPMTSGKTQAQRDEEAKQQKARKALMEAIANGNVTYMNLNPVIAFYQFTEKQAYGDQLSITNIPEGTTLGQVKRQYNLPDGALKHMWTKKTDNYDLDSAPVRNGYVYFTVSEFAKNNGLTVDDVKKMFPKSKIK